MRNFLDNSIFLNKDGNINSNKIRKQYFIKNHIELYDNILNHISKYDLESDNFSAMVWFYINDVKKIPLCKQCLNGEVKWNSIRKGYNNFCSRKCRGVYVSSLESTKEKKKHTCMERYGHRVFI